MDFDAKSYQEGPQGMRERPKVSEMGFLLASCHLLSMPELPYAFEERAGSVGMPSLVGLATPWELEALKRRAPP